MTVVRIRKILYEDKKIKYKTRGIRYREPRGEIFPFVITRGEEEVEKKGQEWLD